MDQRLYSAIDASINRAMEGIRVCEDILRFSLRETEYSSSLKDLRHTVRAEASKLPAELLLAARDVEGDGQKFYDTESEMSRSSINDLLRANFRRAIEAVRSLEELSKAALPENPPDFQRIRFTLYSLEKNVMLSGLRKSTMVNFSGALYAIVDAAFVHDERYIEVASAFIDGGARIIQLRVKDAKPGLVIATATGCAAMCRKRGVLFILNDRPDLACIAGAHGVHLGQDDILPSEARKIMPPHMIIGLSTHSPEQAAAALAEGPDYIAIGPVFGTTSKYGTPLEAIGTGVISGIREAVPLPLVAIGGIGPHNVGEVMAAGADSCAVISALYRDGAYTENCRALLRAMDAGKTGQPGKRS